MSKKFVGSIVARTEGESADMAITLAQEYCSHGDNDEADALPRRLFFKNANVGHVRWRTAQARSAEQQGNTFPSSFPGPAPTEPGASDGEEASSNLAIVEPPRNSHGGGAKVQLIFAGRKAARSVTPPLARFVNGRSGPEVRAMICAARNGAEGRSFCAAER